MNRASTLFLRLSIIGMGLFVTLLCILALPAVYANWGPEFPEIAYLRYPVILALAATAVAFFGALYNAIKLLGYIDSGTAFSKTSIETLGNIKYCALIISAIYAFAIPLFYYIAQQDDAPGLIVFGTIFAGIPLTIAVFTGVVQKLLENVIKIKSENDLTV